MPYNYQDPNFVSNFNAKPMVQDFMVSQPTAANPNAQGQDPTATARPTASSWTSGGLTTTGIMNPFGLSQNNASMGYMGAGAAGSTPSRTGSTPAVTSNQVPSGGGGSFNGMPIPSVRRVDGQLQAGSGSPGQDYAQDANGDWWWQAGKSGQTPMQNAQGSGLANGNNGYTGANFDGSGQTGAGQWQNGQWVPDFAPFGFGNTDPMGDARRAAAQAGQRSQYDDPTFRSRSISPQGQANGLDPGFDPRSPEFYGNGQGPSMSDLASMMPMIQQLLQSLFGGSGGGVFGNSDFSGQGGWPESNPGNSIQQQLPRFNESASGSTLWDRIGHTVAG